LYQESISILYFFFHLPTWLGHADANRDRREYISAREVSFAKFLFLSSWFAKFFESNILQKIYRCVVSSGHFLPGAASARTSDPGASNEWVHDHQIKVL
jgi:hypothetical protein